MGIPAAYESLPKIVKIILQLLFGSVIGGVYRILRFLETKNIVTLVVGILFLVTGVGNAIAWVVDLITEIINNKITFLADWFANEKGWRKSHPFLYHRKFCNIERSSSYSILRFSKKAITVSLCRAYFSSFLFFAIMITEKKLNFLSGRSK